MNWLLVAAASPSPTAPQQTYTGDPSKVTPGLAGAVIFVILLVAAYVLFRSLSKQLRKVPPTFEAESTENGPRPPADDSGPLPPAGR